MHFLTSNFNLLHSNSLWNSLKKNNVIIDDNFDSYHLNLLNIQLLNKYDSFHIIIFLDNENFINNKKKINSLGKNFKKHSSKPFFIYFSFSKNLEKKKIHQISKKLKKLKKSSGNIFYEFLFEEQKKTYNNRNLNILKFPFEVNIISNFSSVINKKINIMNSRPYKLLILDCDNTLWGGVLNEDNFSDIKYNNKKEVDFTFKDFQEKIKKLKNKGFLLSLCSKNNENQVWSFFKKKKMILQKSDFILSKINWNEKSNNINFIIKNLNLRPEDCIFIDDNILEIEKVKRKIKYINTFHLKDISKAKKLFDYDNRLNKFIASREDIKKYKQYKLKSKFTNYISSEKIVPSLLKGLSQKIKISNCNRFNLKRTEELFNKTNQFNFSLNRYKISDLLNMLDRKNFELKLFSLKDKFGDHGIIGAYILKKSGDVIIINDFVLSCRVLYRYVEEFILCHIIKKNPKKKIEIIYKKTNINSNLIPKFLEKNYFSLLYKDKDRFFYKVQFRKRYINETEKIFK